MSNFKFGQKVTHKLYRLGIYGKNADLKTTKLSQVMFESYGFITVLTDEITPVSDWIPCGLSSLPDVRIQTDNTAPTSKEIFFETSDGVIYHGQYCEDETGDYPKYFIADLYDEVILIGDVKRWMYVPS